MSSPTNTVDTSNPPRMEQSKPKTIPEQLREVRDAQQSEVERLWILLDKAKAELKKLDKALKQWDEK